MRLIHLTGAADWAAAQRVGRYPAAGLAAREFLHACTASQLAGVLARSEGAGAGAADGAELPGPRSAVLLVLEASACGDAGAGVRWAYPKSAGGPYPHVHGAVPVDAVVAVLTLARSGDEALEAPDPSVLAGLSVLELPPSGDGSST